MNSLALEIERLVKDLRAKHPKAALRRFEGFLEIATERRAPPILDSRQRGGKPSRFWFPDLPAEPWHDPADYPWMRTFEKNFPKVRAELLAAAAKGAAPTLSLDERDDFAR